MSKGILSGTPGHLGASGSNPGQQQRCGGGEAESAAGHGVLPSNPMPALLPVGVHLTSTGAACQCWMSEAEQIAHAEPTQPARGQRTRQCRISQRGQAELHHDDRWCSAQRSKQHQAANRMACLGIEFATISARMPAR